MRILLITQWFDPEPTFKGLAFARELVKQGHSVQVITGFPNYPTGKIYPGYKVKPIQKEKIDGVDIHRVALYPSHDSSAIARAWNYISFAITSCLYGLFFSKRPDVIYAYHPPITVGMSAGFIGFFRRVPVVYDIQDMWPDTLKATGMLNNPKALSLIAKICQWVYGRAKYIVVLSPGFKNLLVHRGVPEKKIRIIYNWCDEQALTQNFSHVDTPYELENRFNVIFAGNMGKAQALESVIHAAQLIQKKSDITKAVQFVFIGGGTEVDILKQLAQQNNITNVLFLPRVPMDEIGAILNRADALLVHLKDDPLFEITIPSKTQAYMAIGKPIIMAVKGDAADLINLSQSGIAVLPENPEAIAQAIYDLVHLPQEQLAQLGRNAENYYMQNLSLTQGVINFTKVFEESLK